MKINSSTTVKKEMKQQQGEQLTDETINETTGISCVGRMMQRLGLQNETTETPALLHCVFL